MTYVTFWGVGEREEIIAHMFQEEKFGMRKTWINLDFFETQRSTKATKEIPFVPPAWPLCLGSFS
jgi:hypothetical protein